MISSREGVGHFASRCALCLEEVEITDCTLLHYDKARIF